MFSSAYTTIPFTFSCRNFIFSNICISVNTIFECIYMFFGCETDHPLSAYLTGGGIGGHPKCAKLRIEGGSITLNVYLLTYTISFHVFGSILVL